MEMQFDKIPMTYLQKLAGQLHTQEQTLEVRLPEGMPDIGHVLGAWGQMIVRGKEWNADHAAVACGVMAWVLYVPEDEEGVRSVEAWLPFSMKWDLPDTRHDGKIRMTGLVKSVDARSTSARKLLVRASLDAMADAWLTAQAEIPAPGELPSDIQIRQATYPVLLPKEVGEKTFLLEDSLSLPAGSSKAEKLMYYTLQPEILEQKVMAGKVVFRGNGLLHVLYRTDDGSLCTADFDIPFSQYADLEGTYDQDASVSVYPCVTSLDVMLDENGELQVKAGLLGQYLLCDRTEVTVTEDLYSPHRTATPVTETLQLPAVLDQTEQKLHAEQTVQADARQLVDVSFYPAYGQTERVDDGVEVTASGYFQMLYYDPENTLCSMISPWQGRRSMAAAPESVLSTRIFPAGRPQGVPGVETVTLRADVQADTVTAAGQGIVAVTGAQLGEMEKPDPARPALILCRKGTWSLWDIAKKTGTTVDKILQANRLETEPEEDAILLIPVS